MARIDQFDLRAPRGGGTNAIVDTGNPFDHLARIGADMASRWSAIADQRARKEGQAAGATAAAAIEMPDIRYTLGTGEIAPATSDAAQIRKALLDTIAGPESSGRYDVIYGGERFTEMKDHPRKSVQIRTGPNAGKTSSAAGRYQFLGSTWDEQAAKLGLKDFSPESQDKAAWNLAAERFKAETGADLEQALMSRDPARLAEIGKALAPTWTSLPGGIEQQVNEGAFARAFLQNLTGAPAPMELRATLSGRVGTMPTIGDGSIYGEAYDQAARDIYVNRAETAMLAQMEGLALNHRDDPATLNDKLDALRAGSLEAMPPELRPAFEGLYQRQKLGLMRDATREARRKLDEQALAASEQGLATRRTAMMQLAARVGIDPEADRAVAAELEDFHRLVDRSPITPAAKANLKEQATAELTAARVTGHFENLPDAGARAAFAAAFQTEWKQGKGLAGQVTPEGYNKLTSAFAQRVAADQAQNDRALREIETSVDGYLKRLKEGYGVPAAEITALDQKVKAANNPAAGQALSFFRQLNDWTNANRMARPEQIGEQVAGLEQQMSIDGATERGMQALDVMKGLQAEAERGLKENPLKWAERAGIAQLRPLDASTPQSLTSSLQARAVEAETVANHYGRQPNYFTAAEKTQLANRSQTDPSFLPRFAAAIRAGLGDKTPKALAELSTDAPLLAHAAGLSYMTGDDKLLTEVGRAIELRNIPGYKSALTNETRRRTLASDTLGGALQLLPAETNAAITMADALWEARAQAGRFDPSGIGTSGSAAEEAWAQALDEALGARIVNGEKRGGIGELNGSPVILPPNVTSQEAQDAIDTLSDADLRQLPPMLSIDGLPVRPHQLRNGTFVTVGAGRYRIAMGDPFSDTPKWLLTPSGDYWTLDLDRVAKAQAQSRLRSNFSASPDDMMLE